MLTHGRDETLKKGAFQVLILKDDSQLFLGVTGRLD